MALIMAQNKDNNGLRTQVPSSRTAIKSQTKAERNLRLPPIGKNNPVNEYADEYVMPK
jgi:hypothetical protein